MTNPNNQTPQIPTMPLSSENLVDSRLQALKQLTPKVFYECEIDFKIEV